MNTENFYKVINKVLDKKEKEVVMMLLKNCDNIDFSNFWNDKYGLHSNSSNIKFLASKGLTTYLTESNYFIKPGSKEWYNQKPYWATTKPIFRKVSKTTVHNRLQSAFRKLSKVAELNNEYEMLEAA